MNQLTCRHCQHSYSLDDPRWKCDCGGLLDLRFRPRLSVGEVAARKPGMWRYREALPIVDDAAVVSFDEGYTPLVEVEIGGRGVLIKQDHLFPTGSYKDRGAAVLISKVRELGVQSVVEDSSGNAGCAVAAYCARAGIECEIFVPESTSAAKLAQIQMYGAKLNRVPGSREDTARAVLEAAEGRYYASHSWNPFFFHGTKTFVFEVCEQLGWKSPDTVVLPVGNGTLLLGCHIGFTELLEMGVIETKPKMVAVQSDGCAPLHQAFHADASEIGAICPEPTLAEGIAIAEPIRGGQILEAVRESGGTFVSVRDDRVRESLMDMARKGFYIEPTSAATIAGLEQYLEASQDEGVVVSVFTGHGLKSAERKGIRY